MPVEFILTASTPPVYCNSWFPFRTNQYCSFINYALKKYQSSLFFNDYCCTILFILYFVILPCIFFVPTFHCTSYFCISISIV